MPVDEDINLDASDGLSQEDIDELKRQADELENIAVKSEKNVETIKKNYKDVFEGKDFKTKDIMMGDPKPLDISKLEGLEELNERMIELEKIVAELTVSAVDAKDDREELSEEVKRAIEERKEMLRQFNEIKSTAQNVYGEVMSFRGNPVGQAISKLKGFARGAGLYGMIGVFLFEFGEQLYNQIWTEIKNQFKAGGVFDTRKLVQNEVREYATMDYLIKVKSGQVIFTGDSGQDLVQGAIRGAYNTRDLRDGHLRYIQISRGF